MVILVKIGAKNNGTTDEIKSICWRLGRSYHDGRERKRRKRPMKIGIESEKEEEIVAKYRERLLEILRRK